MSKYFSNRHKKLEAYTPGEQPRDKSYVKLNTNESPFPPNEATIKAAAEAAKNLQLYCDPTSKALIDAIAKAEGVRPSQVLVGNGSDELLGFCFLAFCDETHPAAFADITYGFYPVFARLYGIEFAEIPLKDDFSIDCDDYVGINKNIFIANPNAPTGLFLDLSKIEKIAKGNPNNVVVIDEAYIDFGGQSAKGLIEKNKNIIVVRTFSKSRSLAGARLGYLIANESIIADLNTIKYSTNPYNVNSMTAAAGKAAIEDEDGYFSKNCKFIAKQRDFLIEELSKLGFLTLKSKSNFIFTTHSKIPGFELYSKLKDKGILVRHFQKDRISNYVRITIGNKEQTDALLNAIRQILEEI